MEVLVSEKDDGNPISKHLEQRNTLLVENRETVPLDGPCIYIRPRELEQMLGVCGMTIYRWERDGLFPPREEIGPNSVGWPKFVVFEWLKARPIAGPRGSRQKRSKRTAHINDTPMSIGCEEPRLLSGSPSEAKDKP
jgi:predicted DNA-binding transcriptional regulator AlpA